MKTKILLSVTALFLITGAFGQKGTIELTFTAENNGQYVPLDSIFIENLTQGGNMTLIWPDTVLMLTYVGIETNGLNSMGERLQVFQNYPNPVVDQTTITLFIPEKDHVGITVTDILGRKMIDREMTLERGYHTFRYLPGEGKICFFSAFWQGTGSSIKILAAGSGSGRESHLEYTGNKIVEPQLKSLGSVQNFLFELGDELLYIGYTETLAGFSGSDVIDDAPRTDKTYTFDISEGVPCPGTPMVTDIEGNIYYTVQIGEQCWMAENLKTTKFNDGTDIPLVTDNTAWSALSTPGYCWYMNNITYGDTYGALYNWYTAETVNLCPTGWHVPADEEWTALTDHLGGLTVAGGKLKDTGTTHWVSPNAGATNETGFTGLPGGERNFSTAAFNYIGTNGFFWASTGPPLTPNSAWTYYLAHDDSQVHRVLNTKSYGFSVRCLKDN